MGAMKCCHVRTSEDEQHAWRAAAAVRLNNVKTFRPLRRFTAVMVLVMYSLYPTIVASTASIFNCSDPIGDGRKRYLMMGLMVTCYSGFHSVFFACACASVVFYCVGTPLGFALMLIFTVRGRGPSRSKSGGADKKKTE